MPTRPLRHLRGELATVALATVSLASFEAGWVPRRPG
jgi:hypothetical protein